ncbi:MAG TPA: flagellar biosynthesis protein FlhB [Planctomycetes bacterium]|nr:flagellar biosynthesis protein FlhB [Planctomycetota bacterium]
MGLFNDKDDKTEKATPKRLSDARNKGQAAKSTELSTAVALLASVLIFQITGTNLVHALKSILQAGLSIPTPERGDRDWAIQLIQRTIGEVAPALIPFMLTLVVIGILVGIAQVGWKISYEPLKPKFEKLNPIAGLSKLFSPKALVKAILGALKLILIGLVLYLNLSADWGIILNLGDMPFERSSMIVAGIILKSLWWIAVPLCALAILDLLYQKWQFRRDMRMSKQDIKDEQKSTEGDPEVKARIKRAQREIARRRMMEEVPKADVVITNPTHFAVALRYDQDTMAAPKVVAKGQDELAARIREIAREHDVPLLASPPLARALYFSTRVDQEIPAGLYEAVARVLAYLYQVKAARGGKPKDLRLDDVPIPPEFRR